MFQVENEATLLAKIKAQRAATDAIEERIDELHHALSAANGELSNMKSFPEYDLSISRLREIKAQAEQRLRQSDQQVRELEQRVETYQTQNIQLESKVNKLGVLVEVQYKRLNELRNRASLAFFGIRGDIGKDCAPGSGGFIVSEPGFARKRHANEVGTLDSMHAVRTLELDGEWPRNWAATITQRAESLSAELEALRIKLEYLKEKDEFSQRFTQWALVVDQLRVIEAAHHELRMELLRVEVEEDLIQPEATFADKVDQLFNNYFETQAEIGRRIECVLQDHNNFNHLQEMGEN
ncbi:hypothetical protein HDU97_003795 [Phlyctochytrium planicorne]|nr:hypothetical protein HDU97_003795 [Phlyctochytrium planicorne]